MANENEEPNDRIRADLRLILGGRFSPDSVGPEIYDDIVRRLREQAATYLDAFDHLLDDPEIPPQVLAEMRAPALLHLLRDAAPERVRESATRWLEGLDRAPATRAAKMSFDAAPAADAEDEVRRQLRIEERRQALLRLAEEP